MASTGRLRRYVPFDVAESTLRAAAEAVADEYPGVLIEGVVGDFRRHLGAIPDGWPAAVRLPRRHDRQPAAGGPADVPRRADGDDGARATRCSSAPIW